MWWYLEVDGIDEDQDGIGVQCPCWQRVLDPVLSLVGYPVVDGDPGTLWVLLQNRTRIIGVTGLRVYRRVGGAVTLKLSGCSLAP